MIEENKNPDNAGKKLEDLAGKPFQKGYDPRRNLKGRPRGSRNFSTVFNLAIENIRKKSELKIDDPEVEMMSVAIKEALKGESKFFIYLMNKKYGMPTQSIDLGTDKTIEEIEIKIKSKENETTTGGGQKHNKSIQEEPVGVSGKKTQDNN